MKLRTFKVFIALFQLLFVHCSCDDDNPASSLSKIPEGDFIAMNYHYYTNTDTIFVVMPQCHCIRDSLISKVSVRGIPTGLTQDSLVLQIAELGDLGAAKDQSAKLFESYLRGSPGSGIQGQWVFSSEWIEATGEISSADSIRVETYHDKSRAWLLFTQSEFAIYCWASQKERYYASFEKRYGGTVATYNVRIDSLALDSLRLIGNESKDTVIVSRDTSGTITWSIGNTDTTVYKPNPYYFNSIAVYNKSSSCNEYPAWISVFLKSNPLVLEKAGL